MMEKRLIEMLNKFGYGSEWVESSILSLDFFNQQVQDQERSGHTGFEHYRYGMFRYWLESRSEAGDAELLDYVRLALSEPDKGMGCSALYDLLRVSWLTDEQYDSLIGHLTSCGEGIKNKISQVSLLRKLRSSDLTNEVFEACLRGGGGEVHNELINRRDITREQMRILSEIGCNKKIRNMASQYYKSNKMWPHERE